LDTCVYPALVRRLLLASVCLVLVASACGGGTKLAGEEGVKHGIAPEISLRDQDGRLVDLGQQRGRVVVLTFLYTNCKDICPVIAGRLNAVLANLPAADRARTRVVAVSVDPRGDTFASVRSYATAKHLLPQFRYLVGSRQELERVWQDYGIVIDPISLDSIDHTGRIIVIDPRGRMRAGFPPTASTTTVLADVKKLL
jgi:protein SCO1/2